MVHDLIGAGQRRIVLDGVYSWTEYKLLKKEFPGAMTVVAVVAAREERYRRVAARTDRAFDRKAIMERDYAEIENLEKGGPIAIADYYLLNDGTREELQEKMEGVARKVGLIE